MEEKKGSGGDLNRRIRVKYGLLDVPTDAQVAEWARRVPFYINAGQEAEDAGRRAAFDVFGDVDALALFSEADTIEALLKKAAKK